MTKIIAIILTALLLSGCGHATGKFQEPWIWRTGK